MIEKNAFDYWLAKQEVEYTSTLLPAKLGSKIINRLCFVVLLTGGYKVTLRSEIIYSGDSFTEASDTYNDTLAKKN